MASNVYDAIIIGGGHNGLTAGAYFAREGARTVVLEARNKTGGAADTSAPFAEHPDINVTTYSYVMSLMPPTIIRELKLKQFGYDVTPFGPYFQAFPDGRAVTVYADDNQKSYDSIAQFSKRDADTLPKWEEWLKGVSDVLGPLLLRVPPHVGSMKPADLQLIDSDPKDPFDFFPSKYQGQLVAGYSKNTPSGALRTYMPDYGDLAGVKDLVPGQQNPKRRQ